MAAERQTWPLLSRIQANSQVELTLDRCVQRLRSRVSEENEAAANKAVEAAPKKATIDRTPSFYTSRSIVNLSGLSVSDPLPNASSFPKPHDVRSYLNYDPLTFDVEGDDIPLVDDSGFNNLGNMKSPKFLTSENGNNRRRMSNSTPLYPQQQREEEDASSLSNLPAAQPMHRRNYSISSNDSTPGMYLNSSSDQLEGLASNEGRGGELPFQRESRIKK
jgi:hypothetical protein